MIYFDNAATSLIKPAAVERNVIRAMRTMASPGRGGHEPSMRAAKTVFNCREVVSDFFNVGDPTKVIFTQNATHALNIAIFSSVRRGERVLISGFEHNSVTRPLHALGTELVVAGRELFNADRMIEDVKKNIDGVKAVVCTHVSNVFGYILPICEIADVCRKHDVPLIVDASQSAGVLDVDFQRLNAAYIAMPGHKSLFGPQGTGILLCGREAEPLLYGGSGSDSRSQTMPEVLPERLEAGTANVCGIAGLMAGIEYIREKGRENILRHEKTLLDRMTQELEDVPGIRLFHSEKDDQCGVLSFTVNGQSSESFAEKLSENGVCVRPGLHCAPIAHESAGTLQTGTVRLSFSPFNTEDEVEHAAEFIRKMI